MLSTAPKEAGGCILLCAGRSKWKSRVATQSKLTLSKPRQLWEHRYQQGGGSSCGMAGVSPANYDATADGKRFVMVEDKDRDTVARQVNVVLNFAQELKRAASSRRN